VKSRENRSQTLEITVFQCVGVAGIEPARSTAITLNMRHFLIFRAKIMPKLIFVLLVFLITYAAYSQDRRQESIHRND
jgi:hypothetical protein